MHSYSKCTSISLLKCLSKHNLLVDDKICLNKHRLNIRDYMHDALYCGRYAFPMICLLLGNVSILYSILFI
jgi:hypothetical protein